MKKRLIGLLAGFGAVLLVTGCEPSSKPEMVRMEKSAYEQLVKERNDYKSEADSLKKQKPFEVVQGLSKDQCTALANEIVEKSCTAKATASVKPSGKTSTASRTTTRRRAPVAGRSTATATAAATGNATATATATAGGSAPAIAPPAASTSTLELPPAPTGGTFWGWVTPYSTPAAKGKCYADRQIAGMPEQCSSVEVFPRQGNESEVEWNSRVAAKNGIAKGVKDAKGTVSGTTFGRVQVK